MISLGTQFNWLTVIQFVGTQKGHYMYKCLCICGAVKILAYSSFVYGRQISCGCFSSAGKKERINHGHARKDHVTSEYGAWQHMISRCYSKKVWNYKNYGGRGIEVCDRWRKSFTNFLHDMQCKPTRGYSLDRINNYGNYGPGNCRWATRKQQANNKRRK